MNKGKNEYICHFYSNYVKHFYILDKILNCIKFCWKHNLPLRRLDESNKYSNSTNIGVFLDIGDLCKDLYVSLRSHFENSKVFEGASKNIHNDCVIVFFWGQKINFT